MYILRSWRDSLSLLAPSNLKLFLLVTLKSTLETYKVLFTRLMPIVVMASVVGVTYLVREIILPSIMNATAFPPPRFGSYILFFLLQSFLIYVQLYVGYCAARPSIGLKDDAYFLYFWRHFCLLMLIPIGIVAVYALITVGLPFLGNYVYMIPLIMSCPFNIIILFFLDSDGSLYELWRSVVRASTMIVYNLPLMSIFFTFEIVSIFGFRALGCYEIWWLASVPFILSVVIINLYTNLYIKKVHEQPDLYFDLPK